MLVSYNVGGGNQTPVFSQSKYPKHSVVSPASKVLRQVLSAALAVFGLPPT